MGYRPERPGVKDLVRVQLHHLPCRVPHVSLSLHRCWCVAASKDRQDATLDALPISLPQTPQPDQRFLLFELVQTFFLI